MLILKKWRVKAETYKWFARGYHTADFSDDEIPTAKGDCDSLYKFIGEYMY